MNRTTLHLLSLGILLLSQGVLARPQSTWEMLGPEAGVLTSLSQDPQDPARLYAAALNRGVFASLDGGSSWNLTALDAAPLIRHLEVSAGSTPGLYAATENDVLRSVDGGASWVSTGFEVSNIVAALGSDDHFVYAVDSRRLYRFDGDSWKRIGNDQLFAGRMIYDLDFDGRNTLYLASIVGLFATEDGGESFRRIAGEILHSVRAIDFHQESGELFVHETSRPEGIFHSMGGAGGTWTRISSQLPFIARLRAFAAPVGGAGRTLLALANGNLYRTDDLGRDWNLLQQNFSTRFETQTLIADRSDSETVYAPGGLGLARSRNGGRNWSLENRGLLALPLDDYAIASEDPAIIYASAHRGLVYSTRNGGALWHLRVRSDGGTLGTPLALDPEVSGTLYRGTTGNVEKSEDGGETWTPSTTRMVCNSVSALAVAPSDPSILYSSGFSLTGGCSIDFPDACFAHRSRDAGLSWTCMPPLGSAQQHLIDPRNASTVYALSRNRVSRSDDGGESWVDLTTGLEPPFLDLDFDPSNPDALYLIDSFGVLRSENGGASWQRWSSAPPPVPVEALVVHPLEPSNIFAVGSGKTMVSSDGGRTFRALPGGDASLGLKEPLVVLPTEPTHLYAGTAGAGVVRRTIPVKSVCVPGADTLCLADGRFEVEVAWRDRSGRSGIGSTRPLTTDTGAFWFFRPSNIELLIKVLDGRPVNGHWWVFYGSLTNVEFTLTIKDTANGRVQTYFNPQGSAAGRNDTRAFEG